MKKESHLLIYAILFFAMITSPFWLWLIAPSKSLNMLILDKTVPNQTYREHKGLVWVLNNAKYFINGKQPYTVMDYKGFDPESKGKYKITPLPASLKPYDVIYLTDEYGVFKDDFYGQNAAGNKSAKIYGGLSSNEADEIEQELTGSKGKTLIAEFNTFASPTTNSAKDQIAGLLNVDWTGWIGRYFSDLNNSEVPVWVKQGYEKENKKWNFTGQGIVFVNKNNYIVVISGKDLKDSGALFQLTQGGRQLFKGNFQGKYQYWFDIVNARDQSNILATYELPITAAAQKKLAGYGIPSSFPAVTYHENARFSSYYFSGDYADETEVPSIYQSKGLDAWKRTFGERDSFFWQVYVPMMKDLLKNGLHHVAPQEQADVVTNNGVKTNSKTDPDYIQIQQNGKWKDLLIKGVNMGISKPGDFPGETAITKEEYLRWFQEIGAMNANAIRVYTIHPPAFYEAFYEYNQMAKKPLYLFHGTWVDEGNLTSTQNAFAKVNVDDAKLEIKNIIDIIHGHANLPVRPGHASGVYKYDISKYVLGLIVGTEWDPSMVKNTNEVNASVGQYQGKYFKTTVASPFETWLAGLLNYAVSYETNTYHWQHSMSFTNWVTTDLLKHPAEPLPNEDLVSVDPNHISPTKSFEAGYFASYHVYPYYPDSLNYEKNYLNYVNSKGKKDNYAGYLHELRQAHHMPVLVAEFGVPSSRGLTHKNAYGMNQGFLSEEQQGKIDQQLYDDIVSEGYAGGLAFTWQDEWFNRTWNTMDVDNPDRRPYWDNEQTNEEHFGLLDFEPGTLESAINVDGADADWDMAGVKSSYQSSNPNDPLKEVRMTSNSGYVYFLLKYNLPVNFQKDGTYLLFDTIPNQGETNIPLTSNTNVKTNFGVDFLLKLTGQNSSRMLIDSYYDTFYYQYAQMFNMIPKQPNASKNDNGTFNPIRLALMKPSTIPSTHEAIPFQDYETGVLKFGNGNPKSKDYNSLTDISISPDKKIIEGRIPWALLNFKDPSLKEVMGDVWKHGLSGSVVTDGIRVAVVTTENSKVAQTFPSLNNNELQQNHVFLYTWNDWNDPSYYERLKQSYTIMAQTYRQNSLEDDNK